jgi:hypothetical protein
LIGYTVSPGFGTRFFPTSHGMANRDQQTSAMNSAAACAAIAIICSWVSGCRSGGRLQPSARVRCIQGNSNRTVATPDEARNPDKRSINAESAGEPAPCASTRQLFLLSFFLYTGVLLNTFKAVTAFPLEIGQETMTSTDIFVS